MAQITDEAITNMKGVTFKARVGLPNGIPPGALTKVVEVEGSGDDLRVCVTAEYEKFGGSVSSRPHTLSRKDFCRIARDSIGRP